MNILFIILSETITLVLEVTSLNKFKKTNISLNPSCLLFIPPDKVQSALFIILTMLLSFVTSWFLNFLGDYFSKYWHWRLTLIVLSAFEILLKAIAFCIMFGERFIDMDAKFIHETPVIGLSWNHEDGFPSNSSMDNLSRWAVWVFGDFQGSNKVM
jgi:hypothetical protein